MLDFRGIESPPMNNLVLRVVFISISRAEYILVEASFCNTYRLRRKGLERVEVLQYNERERDRETGKGVGKDWRS